MKRLALVLLPCLLSAAPAIADDLVVADFDGPTYAGWTATGTAFGPGPARGTLPHQQAVSGFAGRGLVNSYAGGDGPTGTLTSPPVKLDRDYVTFLIGGGHHPGTTCVDLLVDDAVVATATGDDAERLDPVTWDVKRWRGKPATLRVVDRETGHWGHVNVDQIVQTDHPAVPPEADVPLYAERYRPQFHFTADRNWLNDPNGLVFHDGQYHLCFQRNPFGLESGNLSWGHAVSPDLLHWRQVADALRPDPTGGMWSGSAVVDWHNTSGFGTGGKPPLVAMYTAAGDTTPESKGQPFTQWLAYSNDAGATWTKSGPVLQQMAGGNRDPKVIWHEPTHRWICALYLDGDRFALLASPDLKHWDKLQELTVPGCSECPDFFPLGDRWVFTSANGKYLVGRFDGQTFVPQTKLLRVEYGRNAYAAQTYSDAPDGRRIQIAWMRGEHYPRMPFNQQMSFPAELTLHETPDGPRLFRNPVREVEQLHGPDRRWADLPLAGDNPLADVTGDLFHVRLDVVPGTATEVGLVVRGQTIRYTTADHTLDALGKAKVPLADGATAGGGGHLRLDVLVDRTSLETYADGGAVTMTSNFRPDPAAPALRLYATGGPARVVTATVWPLRPTVPGADNAGRR